MPRLPLVLLLRISLLVAIAASAALVVQYTNAGNPAFCGAGSGCLAVRLSPYSTLFGVVPLPSIGLAAYSCLFAASLLVRTRRQQLIFAGVAASGALVAVVLLVLQLWVIKNPDGRAAICAWCVAVDSSAIAVAVAAALLVGSPAQRSPGGDGAPQPAATGAPWPGAAWVVAAVAAVLLPFVWGAYPRYPPLPPKIAALADPAKLTIVGFTDFQCPFCRRLHPILNELKQKHAGRLVVVRRMNPLASHLGAEPAARVYLCTPPDKQDAVAHALYEADETELTRAGTIAIGTRLGLEQAALSSCVDAASTTERLAEDKALFTELGGLGLPLTYVGQRPVAGFQEGKLREAVEIELAGGRMGLPLWSMFAALAVVFVAAAFVTWRHAQARQQAAAPA